MVSHSNQLQVAAVGGGEMLVWHLRVWAGLEVPGELNEAMTEGAVGQLLAAICNLTFENDVSRIRVGQAGACQALVELLRRQREQSEEVTRQACAVVGNICKKNRTNREEIGSWGGCELLTDVIRGSPSEETAVQAVRAIGNVAMRMPENQRAFTYATAPHQLTLLLETLSLRLGASPPAGAGAGRRQMPASPGAFRHPSHRTSASSTPRGGVAGLKNKGGSEASTPRGVLRREQAEEAFLQLTIAALTALASHDVRSPLDLLPSLSLSPPLSIDASVARFEELMRFLFCLPPTPIAVGCTVFN